MRASVLIFVAVVLYISPAYAEICSIDITTSPPGANVYLSGAHIGITPMEYMIGSPGLFKVRVEKEGHIPWEKYVEVPQDLTLELKISLTPVGASESPKPIELKEEPKEGAVDKERSGYGQSLIAVVFIIMLAFLAVKAGLEVDKLAIGDLNKKFGWTWVLLTLIVGVFITIKAADEAWLRSMTRAYFRSGHAHMGLLAFLNLLYGLYIDNVPLAENVKRLGSILAVVGAIFTPLGIFAGALLKEPLLIGAGKGLGGAALIVAVAILAYGQLKK